MAKLRERYALALFELSEENNSLKATLDQAILVKNALTEEEVQSYLVHPHVSDTEKKKLFKQAFSDNIGQLLMDFLFLMVDKNREALITPSLSELIHRINRHFNKTEAIVVSARELTETQVENIRALLENKTNMEIELKTRIDSDIMGGFYILIEGRVFDRTVRTDLITMREKLKREGVAHVS